MVISPHFSWFFDGSRINLNVQYIYYNPENRVSLIHIKKTPFGRSDFAAPTSLQGNCRRILQLHALRLQAAPNFTREKSGLAGSECLWWAIFPFLERDLLNIFWVLPDRYPSLLSREQPVLQMPVQFSSCVSSSLWVKVWRKKPPDQFNWSGGPDFSTDATVGPLILGGHGDWLRTTFSHKLPVVWVRQVFWLPDHSTTCAFPTFCQWHLQDSSPVTAAGPFPIFTGFPFSTLEIHFLFFRKEFREGTFTPQGGTELSPGLLTVFWC